MRQVLQRDHATISIGCGATISAMGLAISDRVVRRKTCGDCGLAYDHVTAWVVGEDTAVAAYFAYCHGHPAHEAGIDAVLGTWGRDDVSDHVMFSCILRPEGAMTVDASVAIEPAADDAILGRKLTRDEALSHPWIGRFWQVVDAIAADDPAVVAAVYGPA